MKRQVTKLIVSAMLTAQLVQGFGFAWYNSIQEVGHQLSQDEIIIHNANTISYTDQVMRDEMASVITRWTKTLGNHEQIKNGCNYWDMIRASNAYRQDIKDGCGLGLLTKRSWFSPRARATQGDAIMMFARTIDNSTTDLDAAYTLLIDNNIIDDNWIGQNSNGFTRYWLYDMVYRMNQYNPSTIRDSNEQNITIDNSDNETSLNTQMIKSNLGAWGKIAVTNKKIIAADSTDKSSEGNNATTEQEIIKENTPKTVHKTTTKKTTTSDNTYESEWLNRDDPSGNGDHEYYNSSAADMQVTWACPKGGMPISVVARVIGSQEILSGSQGELQYTQSDTSMGYLCTNDKSTSGMCKDYEVKFTCTIDVKNQTPKATTQTKSANNSIKKLTNTVVGQSYSPVVQVRAYKYNPILKIFSLVAMGSAVLVSDTQAITNAHVVLGEDEEPMYIELCTTYDAEQAPVCNAKARVIKYNKTTTDLALLEYSTIPNKSITTLGVNPTIGDQVLVHGYPVNGQDTITISQGIISGRKGNDYKIDANINHGNSGGGAFDKSGSLTGIPSYGIGDVESIGYIIGINTVKEFISDTTQSTIAKQANYSEFSTYISQRQQDYISNIINTSAYSLSLPNDQTVKFTTKYDPLGISSTAVMSKDGNFASIISTDKVIDGELNKQAIDNIIENKLLRQIDESTISTIKVNDNNWIKIVYKGKESSSIMYMLVHDNIVYSVTTMSKLGKEAEGLQILKNMNIKKVNNTSITQILPGVKISANNGLIPVVGFNLNDGSRLDWVLYSSLNEGSQEFMIEEVSSTDNDETTEIDKDTDYSVYKNKQGQNIFISKTTSSIFSVGMAAASSTVQEKERIFIMVILYDEDSYPILKQVVGWLDTISLGGVDSLDEEATIQSIPQDYFEHIEKAKN